MSHILPFPNAPIQVGIARFQEPANESAPQHSESSKWRYRIVTAPEGMYYVQFQRLTDTDYWSTISHRCTREQANAHIRQQVEDDNHCPQIVPMGDDNA